MSMLALLFTACTPQDATVTANYAMFLADDSSDALNLLRLRNQFDKQKDLVPVDCRTLEDEGERLEGADPACADVAPAWYPWLTQYQYWLKEGSVSSDNDVWRTEAILTSEGDLQLTAHAHVGDFGDFRFGFVINPDFQPQTCEGEGDAAAMTDVDGSWLEGWSANDSGSTVWHLNDSSYQINPNNFNDYWSFPTDWSAGSSFARFGEEVIYHQGVQYAQYSGESLDGPLYYPYIKSGTVETDLPFPDGTIDEWATAIDDELTTRDDIRTLGQAKDFTTEYRVHSNSWRPVDDLEPGLDGWVEVVLGYVTIEGFTPGDKIEAGDANLKGTFQLYMTATDTPSRLLINGEFNITHITQINSYSPSLEEEKREEYGTPACK